MKIFLLWREKSARAGSSLQINVPERLAALFDQYWNSEFTYPVAALVPTETSAATLERRFLELTDATRAPAPAPLRPNAPVRLDAMTFVARTSNRGFAASTKVPDWRLTQ